MEGLNARYCSNVNKRIIRGGGRVYLTYFQPERLLVNPPLLPTNGVTYQFKQKRPALAKAGLHK